MESKPYELRIIRSKRKTICLQIARDLVVTVRAPYRMPNSAIRKFVEEKSSWIEKHMQIMKEKQAAEETEQETAEPLSMEEIRKLADEALEYIPGRVAFYAPKVGVNYGRLTIRNQRSRWGSCSGKGNLNFNCLLMLAPLEVIDYVVVHELCHRREMNHSARFWQEVGRVMPDYGQHKKWLTENGGRIMRRMTG